MSKYDAKLDLSTENSLSVILRMIDSGAKILEFGPAHGRLTQYLQGEMKSQVTIVEIDQEAGAQASQYAERAFLGEEEGDIEKYYWLEGNDKKFDYIIFADVLEHLYNPERVLAQCEKVLKDDGKILISIPNIAHNSIIINLMNDKFQYNNVGLLDNTHIKFFTYYSFKDMVEKLGYRVDAEYSTYSEVGENEIGAKYDDVSLPVQKELKKRSFGRVYQYIFSISKNNDINAKKQVVKNIHTSNLFESKVYIKEKNDVDFSEEKWVAQGYNNPTVKFQVDLSSFDNVKELRIDPCECNCIIRIKDVIGIVNGKEEKLNICWSNANYVAENVFFFETLDPQVKVKVTKPISSVKLHFEMIDYDIDDYGSYRVLTGEIAKCIEQEQKQKDYIKLLEERMNKYKEYQGELEGRIKEHETYQEQLEERITKHKEYQDELEERIKQHELYEKQLEEKSNEHEIYQGELEKRLKEHKIYQGELEKRIEEYEVHQKKAEELLQTHKEEVVILEEEFRVKEESWKHEREKMLEEIKQYKEYIEKMKKSKLFRFIKI